ncbi:hypothetical protein PIA91_04145 [Klebsiella michiganensis]|uniref:hypothetical protein n=1 Tax=Klebsiella michiganensis TaxID=1134687 RepID=UPI00237AB690|nr:hypothetical protein [Klebsiella michiganensis]MDD9627950.1 hypothetical protein [Klebsiella michiganensis]MDD9633825.1 hypothetical protein [Klebsiella michiganensis]MDD9645224.1 hypothetical protein [Klebsiella michiganensis]MDD9659956.1 hypothetical protein [Klebsiella michiganensis]
MHAYNLVKNKYNLIEIVLYNEKAKGMPVVIAPGFLTYNDKSWAIKLSKVLKSPIIFVNWQSSNSNELLKKSIIPIVSGLAMPQHSVKIPINVIMMIKKVWDECSQDSYHAGDRLACFLNDVWDEDDRAIFLGHSLGVRIITGAMSRLNNKNIFSSVSIAGAMPSEYYEINLKLCKDYESIEHKISITIRTVFCNCYIKLVSGILKINLLVCQSLALGMLKI